METWKEIPGLPGYYQVSDQGRVATLKHGFRVYRPEKTKTGYYQVCIERKRYKIHRLVALAFVPNPDGLPQVNHKNENKADNRVENLEWCTQQYNNTYNGRHTKCAEKIKKSNTIRSGKPINQFTLDGEFVASYPSAWEASRQTGFTKQGIMIACHGGQMRKNKWVNTLQYKGYIWKYANN